MQSLFLRWCLGRQLAFIHKQPHCQPKIHLPPDCQISTSPCAEEEAAPAVLSRKHSQFCKLRVITLGFLLCKDRKRVALKLLQWMETHTHKRQLYSEFLRNIQGTKRGPEGWPWVENICECRSPCQPEKQEVTFLPPFPLSPPSLLLWHHPPFFSHSLCLLHNATETTF